MPSQDYEHANLSDIRDQILANARVIMLLDGSPNRSSNAIGDKLEVVTTFELGTYGAAIICCPSFERFAMSTGFGSPVEALEALWHATSEKLGNATLSDKVQVHAHAGSDVQHDGLASGYA